MAYLRKRKVDYVQLNSLSSVVLYNNSPKPRKGKLYQVERIIAKRRVHCDYEYLIKWQDWPLDTCSWEVSSNLTPDLLRNYDKPTNITSTRLELAARAFSCGILAALKSPSFLPVYINIELDVWRYVTHQKGKPSQHHGHFLFEKEDLSRLKLSMHWWYYMNEHGEGMAIDFPLKIKPVLSWSPSHCIVKQGIVCKAPRFPVEKLCITVVKRPCNLENL